MATRTLTIAFNGDTRGLERASREGEGHVESFGEKFKRWNKIAVASSLIVIGAAFKVAKDLKSRSEDIASSMALAEAAFGDQLPRVEAWAEGVRRAAGMSRQEVIAATTNSQDMLVGFGMAEGAAADLTMQNWELAEALAATSGGTVTTEEAFERLTKATVGETDGLKALGTVVNAQMIQDRLREKGLEDLTGMERKQAEALAIQELAYEQNQHKVDMYNDGLREQMENQNGTASSMAQLRDNLAVALTPAFEKFNEIVNKASEFIAENSDLVLKLGAAVVGLAAFVLGANAAWKVYTATKRAVILVTKAFTVAQRALNLVMRANPIGIVITLIAALVAGIVIAYNRSQTFRNIVQGAMRAVQTAFGWVLDRGRTLVSWFGTAVSRIRSVFSGLGSAISAPFRAGFNAVRSLWNSTIGKISFTIPGWVPGVGGKGFSFPRMHSGGVFMPPSGQSEGLALLRRGERVLTPGQDQAQGEVNVTVNLSQRMIEGLAEVVVSRGNRVLRRQVVSGAGVV